MSAVHRLCEAWFVWIAAASWQLAVLVAVVALVAWAASSLALSPRLRHGLWLLVLIKAFLPPGLATPLSLGYWSADPIWQHAKPILQAVAIDKNTRAQSGQAASDSSDGTESNLAPPLPLGPSVAAILLVTWAGGCCVFFSVVGWRYFRLVRSLQSARVIDEGPLCVTLEEIALVLGLKRTPELLATEVATSPFLFGVLRPRIVVPQELFERLDAVQWRAILTHELVHWQRHDTILGWLQVVAQGAFWFHPLVWWANRQLRHERECACDETVLRLGDVTPDLYSESLVRVLLTASTGRALAAGNLVGVFERGAKLQNRLEEIMRYEPMRARFGWISRLALAALALVLLPMAPRGADQQLASAQDGKGKQTTPSSNVPYPVIVSTTPKIGALDVDPGLKEISVTFDRDMGKGMSWTGGPPMFPPSDDTAKARWTNDRTCVLPVKMENGAYYRVGINSMSFKNFRGQDGTPAPPSAIYFVTRGASPEVQQRTNTPKIVKIDPPNEAQDVDPTTKLLSVTFDMPMGGGMSWVGGGAQFPQSPEGATATWSSDRRTCTLPVKLEPNHEYLLGFNSLSHNNFQSESGVPLAPVTYRFKTGGAK